jgi:hypothetical protein
MKLKTAALIAAIGNTLGMLYHISVIWEILPPYNMGWTFSQVSMNGTLIVFLFVIFQKSK